MSARAARFVVAIGVLLALLAGLGHEASDLAGQAAPAAGTEIPDDALWVGAGHPFATIGDALAVAGSGATIAVDGGEWAGPVEIATSVRLIGVNHPVIDGHHDGTIVRITAPDVVLEGFTLQHTGSNFDKEDSAVYVEAERVQVIDNRMIDTLFGINAATAHDSVFAGNFISGRDVETGIRGDAIKVWYSHRVQITGNDVEGARDLLIWYSDNVLVSGNTVRDSRYGFHFMNSNDGVVERNRLENNSVAIYLMYGRNFTIRDNLLQGSRGPSGHGLGLKEIDGVVVEGNIIYDNRIGIFIDNSPLSPNVYSYFRGNLIAYNDQGLGVLPSSRNNIFSGNSMIDNLEQVAVLGGGKLGANEWTENGEGNFWSDYAGYDADGDGIGDIPFRSEHLSEQLMHSWPQLQLFRFSVAETAVDFGSRALPMFRQEPILVDAAPLVAPVLPVNAPDPARNASSATTTIVSLLMLAGAAGVLWWGIRGSADNVTAASRRSGGAMTAIRAPEPGREPMGEAGP
jgi:nitrous oxidase accessory protein